MTDKPQTRDLSKIQTWVSNGHDLSGGDFSAALLKHLTLMNGLFSKADFHDSDLSHSCLEGADLREANFREAQLYCTRLDYANLTGADLTGAYLADADIGTTIFTDCKGIYDAGIDPRGYRFVGVKQIDCDGLEYWRVKAGCRWFSIEDAEDHWHSKGNRDALDRVAKIEAAE